MKLYGLCAGNWMAVILLALLPACAPRPQAVTPAELTLLPQPRHLALAGAGFRITPRTALLLHDTVAAPVARYLREWLGQAGTALPAPRFAVDTTGPGIHFSLTSSPGPDSLREQYQLRVTARGIWLRACTPDGLFWGVQTLRQLLPVSAESRPNSQPAPVLLVPGLQVLDRPALAWRGLMLDVSRHFLPMAQLRRYVDLLALHKLNRLHLHLADDQGWRLPSRAWPRLTTVGAFRTGPDGQPYGGFYSTGELSELVAYARTRHVELLPEIDLPGHARAALAAYPELSCTGQALPVATDWGVHEDVLCVGNPRAVRFAADVLGEVMDLFPGRYVHVGGDETPTTRWRACPKCQALMRRENLRSEHELQGYFLRQVAAVLKARGRQPLVWDEALTWAGTPPPAGTVVQAWHGLAPVAAAVRAGYGAVASPSSFAYFDQNTAILDLAKVFRFTPVPAGLTVAERRRVLGAEAALWTERIEPRQVDQAAFPRLLALAEVVWAGPQPPAAYPDFLARARRHYPRLAALGVQVGFETRPLAVVTTPTPTGLRAALTPGGTDIALHVTQDGTAPTLATTAYAAPLEITRPTRLRALASRGGAPVAELAPVQLWPHAATGAAVTLAAPAHPAYPASGLRALADGVLGSTDYRDGNWQGFEKNDLNVTLDLGQPRQLDSVAVAFLQDYNSWIFLPRHVQFSVSTDGEAFADVAEMTISEPLTLVGPLRRCYRAALGPGPVRYLRVRARNVGVCPPSHPGAGGGAFLMVDEVVVRARW